MRYLIISDVHGNQFGLEAVLEAGRGCSAIVCLGDIVGYGAHPNECCEILRDRRAICLSGNHDAAALGLIDIEWFNPVAKAAITWTRDELTVDNAQWLKSLPAEGEVTAGKFQMVHASLRKPWQEYIVNPEVALASLELMKQPLCFYGHTHEADVYRLENPPAGIAADPGQVQYLKFPTGGKIALKAGFRYLVNPGSCGQPRDGDARAKCAIFDVAKREIEILAVSYPYFDAYLAIVEAGLPEVLGQRLCDGR